MSETELGLHIGRADILKRPVKIQMTTATSGEGLDLGFEWYPGVAVQTNGLGWWMQSRGTHIHRVKPCTVVYSQRV